jgi:hypothetical protein
VTAPANVAAWFSNESTVPLMAPPRTEVLLDSVAQPRLQLDTLELRQGAAPRAWFSAGLGRSAETGEEARLEHLAPHVRPGALVSVRLLRGGVLPGAEHRNLVIFEGRISRINLGLSPEDESLRFEAEDLATELLRRRIGGQRLRTSTGETGVMGLALGFNLDGQANASAAPYTPGSGEDYTIFAPASQGGAQAWTLAEAVAYLVTEYGQSDVVGAPPPTEVRSGLGNTILRDVRLEGRTLGEALEALLELAGGMTTVAVEPHETGVSRRLEIFTPDRAPTCWLAHQGVGVRFDPAATHFSDLAVTMRFEAAPRRYAARGDRKVYESTFDLMRGWAEALGSNNPEEFNPSQNPNFDSVRDVFRKWVLNESGEYSESPYNSGPAADLSAIFEGAAYAPRRRRFLECLSCDALGRSFGVYIEISLDGGSSWQRMAMAARVLRHECGIYLTDDPLPPAFIMAAMRGYVRVRVTAAIESDSCIMAEGDEAGADDLPGRTRYLNVPAGYRYRKRASTSRFSGQTSADEADDTPRLQEFVRAACEADRRCPVPTHVEVPWLALGYRVGQRVLGVRGRRLDFARREGGYESAPMVRTVRWHFTPSPRTELELE